MRKGCSAWAPPRDVKVPGHAVLHSCRPLGAGQANKMAYYRAAVGVGWENWNHRIKVPWPITCEAVVGNPATDALAGMTGRY